MRMGKQQKDLYIVTNLQHIRIIVPRFTGYKNKLDHPSSSSLSSPCAAKTVFRRVPACPGVSRRLDQGDRSSERVRLWRMFEASPLPECGSTVLGVTQSQLSEGGTRLSATRSELIGLFPRAGPRTAVSRKLYGHPPQFRTTRPIGTCGENLTDNKDRFIIYLHLDRRMKTGSYRLPRAKGQI